MTAPPGKPDVCAPPIEAVLSAAREVCAWPFKRPRECVEHLREALAAYDGAVVDAGLCEPHMTAERAETARPIVHVLHHGYPLCGFTTLIPREWPGFQLWVPIRDAHLATCPQCSEALNELPPDVRRKATR
jgi:hypothetical protein